MFFVTCVGMMLSTLSMAEMASMAPTSGGQYHWVSEFAPQRYQKFLSYMAGMFIGLVGWLSALGWQAGLVVTSYTAAQQFGALIALNVPSYRIQGWHGTLLSIAITAFAIVFNTALARKLPLFEMLVGVLNVLGFVAFLAVLWSMAPGAVKEESGKDDRKKKAWTEFQDNAGWGDVGLATLVGILGPSVTLIGADSACHLSEEVRDASWVLPRSMVVTAAINYTVGFVMTVTVMMTVGDHASEFLDSRTGQVYVQILLDVTQSRAGTSVLTALMAVLLLFCAVNGVTTSSRQLFAFARDNGLPCSRWLATVPTGWDIPVNAIMTTLIITALLSLIIIGSSIAFNVITAIGQVGLYTSYIITLGAIITRRFSRRRGPLPRSRFDLGRAGLPINLGALAFLSVMFPFLFFPSGPSPSPADMNWSCVVYSIVVVFAMIYYFFRGRYVYKGPVEYVRKDI
ncbi:amino acid transporter [Apiospora phragmitis]|uniref:Amino acid transporter n=1 Tax=Apiospora phragmitis TaxID=2905665 RepID=A0ABR1WU46_9PEZI